MNHSFWVMSSSYVSVQKNHTVCMNSLALCLGLIGPRTWFGGGYVQIFYRLTDAPPVMQFGHFYLILYRRFLKHFSAFFWRVRHSPLTLPHDMKAEPPETAIVVFFPQSLCLHEVVHSVFFTKFYSLAVFFYLFSLVVLRQIRRGFSSLYTDNFVFSETVNNEILAIAA